MSTSPDPAAAGVAAYRYEVDPTFPALPDGGTLGEVAGVAVDARDRVYLVNRSAVPVQLYATSGEFIAAWPEADFSRVHGITIAPDGLIYIADDRRHVIRVFTPSGQLLRTLGTPDSPSDTGVVGTDPRTIKQAGPPFNQPTNTAIGQDGSLFVSDGYGNARVHHFTADGELLHSWGTPGTGPGEFMLPHGIAIDPRGRVLVADRENGRIQVFATDGTYVTEYGGLIRPCALHVDPTGTIYVAELGPSHGRVTILDPAGQVVARWAMATDEPKAGGHSIALDRDGSLYVGLVYQGAPLPAQARPVVKYRRV